jgi:hypothetical protein
MYIPDDASFSNARKSGGMNCVVDPFSMSFLESPLLKW